MECRALIVIGASAGGMEALEELVRGLPQGLPAAVCVVLHIGSRRSAAPKILAAAGPLPAVHATDGEAIRPGRIYVAPPDHHLVVKRNRLHLSRGPRENGTRPAADPLFRSAAEFYGPRVIGIILSGMLSDGTAGFSEIKRFGGTTIVQDPDDARFPGMPRSALRYVTVDHRVPASAMPALLTRLVAETTGAATAPGPSEENHGMDGEYALNQPTSLTCPECGGALKETTVDSMPYFTCHIGHRFSAENMDETQFHLVERAFEVAVRALNERAELCRRLAEAARAKAHALSARRWEEAGREARDRAELLVGFLKQDWTRPAANAEDEGQPRRSEGAGGE